MATYTPKPGRPGLAPDDRSSQIELEKITDLNLREIVKVINDRLSRTESKSATMQAFVDALPTTFVTEAQVLSTAQQQIQALAKLKFEGIDNPSTPPPAGGGELPLGGGGGGGAGPPGPGGGGGAGSVWTYPLPDGSGVVQSIFAQYPALVDRSCQTSGGTWELMDLIVDTLRLGDTRWGYNGKRGNPNDPSLDAIAYNGGDQPNEGATQVYVVDVVGGHCACNCTPTVPRPVPTWQNKTDPNGPGAIWISRGRF